MTPNPNDMTTWAEIACQRGCAKHHTRIVRVNLAERHGYRDLAQVPAALAREFLIEIWDTTKHPVDNVGIYCPAHDAVSETILSHGIWEPRETILTLAVLSTAGSGQWFCDMGAQLGWFSLLAFSCGVPVSAFDAEPENLQRLWHSLEVNNDFAILATDSTRIGPDRGLLPVSAFRLAKLDLEGAETDGIRILSPSIDAGLVDHLLVEISPVFKPGDHYPDLVCDLIDRGYEAYLLPEKSNPPRPFTVAEDYLAPYRVDRMMRDGLRAFIATLHQEDMWFRRKGASW